MRNWLLLVALTFLLALAAAVAALGGDGNLARAQAYVDKRCPALERDINQTMWVPGATLNALYGNCKAADGHDQHIWFFVKGRFVGTDAAQSSAEVTGLWGDGRTLAFLYVLYRATDALCCPTGGGRIVRFRWNGKRVVALDKLPALSTSASHPFARYP